VRQAGIKLAQRFAKGRRSSVDFLRELLEPRLRWCAHAGLGADGLCYFTASEFLLSHVVENLEE
jgi:hypothetical protein